MKKAVIGLRGKGNVGKSQTIKKAYKILKSRHKTATEEYLIDGADVRVVLTIKGVKIGIESQGDPGSRLEESLLLFVNVKCTVIICATRTRGQTVSAVESLQPDYKVIWIEQDVRSIVSEHEPSNRAMARRVVEEVEKAMPGGQ
jgi:hypothetical protein